MQDYLSPLLEFLRIDTTSAKGKGAEGAKWLRDFMQDRGVTAELIPWPNTNPYLIGEINVGSDRTVLIYNHYDVQPATPLAYILPSLTTGLNGSESHFSRGSAGWTS